MIERVAEAMNRIATLERDLAELREQVAILAGAFDRMMNSYEGMCGAFHDLGAAIAIAGKETSE